MQNENNNTTKYPLASAGRRIIAKALDIAIISCLVIAIGFAIFTTDPNFKWNEPLVISGWRYGLFVAVMTITFFSLMFFLPCFWKKTIGMKITKLAYYKKDGHNYVFAMFKHELFIWELIVFIALAMGITLSFLNQHQIDSLMKGANAIFASNVPDDVDKVCYYVGTGFSCLYGICIIALIAIIIATCIKNKRPAFHDKYSNLYVYHKVIGSNQHLIPKHISSDIKGPGQLSQDSLQELDNI